MGCPLLRLSFADSLHGWTVGWHLGHRNTFSYCILHTEDGGGTWYRQRGGTGTAEGVSFIDANPGWAVGHDGIVPVHGVIYHTVNGGNTWTVKRLPFRIILHGVAFLDARNGVAVGSQRQIIRTSDGGNVWTDGTIDPSCE